MFARSVGDGANGDTQTAGLAGCGGFQGGGAVVSLGIEDLQRMRDALSLLSR